eukprot:6212456-Pleurochrysis_carterae.AAC.3
MALHFEGEGRSRKGVRVRLLLRALVSREGSRGRLPPPVEDVCRKYNREANDLGLGGATSPGQVDPARRIGRPREHTASEKQTASEKRLTGALLAPRTMSSPAPAQQSLTPTHHPQSDRRRKD